MANLPNPSYTNCLLSGIILGILSGLEGVLSGWVLYISVVLTLLLLLLTFIFLVIGKEAFGQIEYNPSKPEYWKVASPILGRGVLFWGIFVTISSILGSFLNG